MRSYRILTWPQGGINPGTKRKLYISISPLEYLFLNCSNHNDTHYITYIYLINRWPYEFLSHPFHYQYFVEEVNRSRTLSRKLIVKTVSLDNRFFLSLLNSLPLKLLIVVIKINDVADVKIWTAGEGIVWSVLILAGFQCGCQLCVRC